MFCLFARARSPSHFRLPPRITLAIPDQVLKTLRANLYWPAYASRNDSGS